MLKTMGSSCQKSAVNPTSSEEISETGRISPADPLSHEIVRILQNQVGENEGESDELEQPSETSANRLSDLAEKLFLEQLKTGIRAGVEMGNENPIELELEQARRRLQKHRASIVPGGSNRMNLPRGSLPLSFCDSPSIQDARDTIEVRATSALPSSLRGSPEIAMKLPSHPNIQRASPSELIVATTTDGLENKQTHLEKEESTADETKPDIQFQRLYVSGENEDFLMEELRDVSVSLIHALRTRQYYMRLSRQSFPSKVAKVLARIVGKPLKPFVYPDFIEPTEKATFPQDEKHWAIEIKQGIFSVLDNEKGSEVFLPFVNRDRFIANRNLLYALVADGPLKSFCYRRLSYLIKKFNLHCLLNEEAESEIMKSPERKCRRDFYNVRKVDTHIHAAACMGQKHLLGFMQEKARKEPDRVVLRKNGKKMTLKEVFESLDLNPFYLNVDALDVHADRQTFQRFDRFNNLYSPMGASELREIFLKTNNDIDGDYFAEIISQVENNLVEQKYHLLELRISIYGRKYEEWVQLAKWFNSHKLASTHIRWLIQVPRLYDVYKEKGVVQNFEHILDNIFRPVFEATICPSKHKDISLFLRHVVGFDSVDDESKPEHGFMKKTSPTPDEWTRDTNPSYTYYIYYMYANIARLNHLRHSRDMNTFTLRPHCGEAGSHDHIVTGFMLAQNISHGLVLKKVPVLQYLYYLAEIGICMSPLSNNHLFLEYNKSPFPEYFARGLKVCLSTDDPLQFHFTMEPLMEEYAVAAQVWKFSVCDMCEMARTSVRVSSFSHAEMKRWLGDNYRKEGAAGNDISKTNVPDIRVAFREETLLEELRLLSDLFVANARASANQAGDHEQMTEGRKEQEIS